MSEESREMALSLLNDLKDQMAGTARTVVRSLADGKISTFEALGLGLKSLGLAQTFAGVLQGLDKETAADVLYVLENADWVLPPQA